MESAWKELAQTLNKEKLSLEGKDVERLLSAARARHEQRREWGSVARLLELELDLLRGTPVEVALQSELARIFREDLLEYDRSVQAYQRLSALRPDPTITELLEQEAARAERWEQLVERYVSEAKAAGDSTSKVSLLVTAAECVYRYGLRAGDKPELVAQIRSLVEEALALDKRSRRAATLAELIFTRSGAWEDVAQVQGILFAEAPLREDRVAAGLRLGRTLSRRVQDGERAIDTYKRVLELAPGQSDAMSYLAEAFSAASRWDELVALYEDQLRAGGVKPAEEQGIILQIAMVHFKMREDLEAAEPYFDRVRRADPLHPTMLEFFRAFCSEGDKARLTQVLSDAQRAMADGAEKRALAAEIAKLAEAQENAHKAIEQYKSILRSDPANVDAREALKRLYLQSEGYNALVELHRQDLERTDPEKKAERIAILRDIAEIYREKMQSDAALVTVLTQILQLDETDINSVRELVRLYETLGRWRDLLAYQQKLADLSPDALERADLYRAAARRWLDQFSNVQNAVLAYEGLLKVEPEDAEGLIKLEELYQKRRSWAQLYALYEGRLATANGADRVDLLMKMAKLAAERLDRGADAIRLQREVLELNASTPGVFDALEKQAEREKDYVTLADVLERRLAETDDMAARLALLQKLGGVYSDRLKDNEGTIGAWRRVLELSPGHARALRVLREAYVASSDWDQLHDLYESQSDLEGLADFLSTAADKATDAELKKALSFRVAKLFEEEVGAPDRALRSYERVLSVDPTNLVAASALVPLYEADEKWARLAPLYALLLENAETPGRKLEFLKNLQHLYKGPLGDRNAAATFARQAYELTRDEAELITLEEACREAGSWEPLVEVLRAQLGQKKVPKALQRRLRRKLADVLSSLPGSVDEAITLYRGLCEADPSDTETVLAVDAVLKGTGRKDDIRWLYQLRSNQADPIDAAELFLEWARLERDAFEDRARAEGLLRKSAESAGDHPLALDALQELAALLEAEKKSEPLLAVLTQIAEMLPDAERMEQELKIARLLIDPLGRPTEALTACERALELAPNGAAVVTVLEALLQLPDTRADAAKALERVFADRGDASQQAAMLEVLISASPAGAPERLERFVELSRIQQEKLRALGTALETVIRALREFAVDLALWDRAGELANEAGRPTELAEIFREVLVVGRSGSLPPEVELELCERAAALHDERLGDPEGARPYLDRILRVDPANQRAFTRLKQILTALERWGELEQLYERASENTTDDALRLELFNEMALVAEEIIGNVEKAIHYYERIVALDPLHDVARGSLEKLYERQDRFVDLGRLLERKLESLDDAEAIRDTRIHLAKIYLDKTHQPAEALEHLTRTIDADVGDTDARDLLERLLEIGDLRLRSAGLLRLVYEARSDYRNLVRVLDVLLAGAHAEEQKELLRSIGALRYEQLKDDVGAFEVMRRLLPMEPDEPALRETVCEIAMRLREYGKLAQVLEETAAATREPSAKAEILMQVAQIAEDLLSDVDRALAVYNAVLGLSPDDPELCLPAARQLARIYDVKNDAARLAQALELQARFEPDALEKRRILERLGDLYEGSLGQLEDAIRVGEMRIADDPSDAGALEALERLYARAGSHRKLIEVIRSREQISDDSAQRQQLLEKAARVLEIDLQEQEEAIAAWRVVYEEFGPVASALQALRRLLGKAEKWAELAEILEAELGVCDGTPERVGLYVEIGALRRDKLADLPSAFEAYRQALTLDSTAGGARTALAELLDDAEARREAAEILRPLLESENDVPALVRVLKILAETSDVAAERLDLLSQAVDLLEGQSADPGAALTLVLTTLSSAAAEPNAESWFARAETLAESTGRFRDLCQALQEVLPEILDGDLQQQIRLRIAALGRERLRDNALAVKFYLAAVDARSDEVSALTALEEIYAESEEHEQLLQTLRKHLDVSQGDDEARQLLARIAKLQEGPLNEAREATVTYERMLEMATDAPVLEALERLYTSAGRHTDHVSVLERALAERLEEPAEIHLRIARVALGPLGDSDRGFDELREALATHPGHRGTIQLLEGLLSGEDATQRSRAAELLESVYVASGNWERVQVCLEARVDASAAVDEKHELLRRLSALQEEQLEDYVGALNTLSKVFLDDIRDSSVWESLERLAELGSCRRRLADTFASALQGLEVDDVDTIELCKRTARLLVGENAPLYAITWYRRALAFEPESREIFDALDRLLKDEGRPTERVELYNGTLEHRFGDDRLAALRTLAELQNSVGAFSEATAHYEAILAELPDDENVLTALADLYAQTERWDALAELLRRRMDGSSGHAARAYRVQLAQLIHERMGNSSEALDEIGMVLAEDPWNDAAASLAEELLAKPEFQERCLDILTPLYEARDDWNARLRLNELRIANAQEPSDKLELLREGARLWETRGGDLLQATGFWVRAVALDPDDQDSRSELRRMAEARDSWEDLVGALEHAALAVADEGTRVLLLRELGEVYDERLNDPRRALDARTRLWKLDKSDPYTLDDLERLAVLLGDWSRVVQICQERMENDGDAARAVLLRKIGEIRRDMLEDPAGAVEAFEQALEADPESISLLDLLIELYEGREAARRLVELYVRRAAVCSQDDLELRIELQLKAASLYEGPLQNPTEAIQMLRGALDARPGDERILRQVEGLLRAGGNHEELLQNLEEQRRHVTDQGRRIELSKAIASLQLDQLDAPREALAQYRSVLDEQPSDEGALAALLALAQSRTELRGDVVDILEPLLENSARGDELAQVLELKLLGQTDPADRSRTLRRLAEVHERMRSDSGEALATLLRAFSETPMDVGLQGDVQKIAEQTGRFGDIATAFEEGEAKVFDPQGKAALAATTGAIAEERLRDSDRAISAYLRACRAGGDQPEWLEALDRLYGATKQFKLQVDVLERRINLATDALSRADLGMRLTRLQLDELADVPAAVAMLKRISEESPDHEPTRKKLEELASGADMFDELSPIVESIYRAVNDKAALVGLFERRVELSEDEERISSALALSRVIEEELGDSVRAQRTVERNFGANLERLDAVDRLEALAEKTGEWAAAAEALEKALTASRITAEQAFDLWRRLSGWSRDRAADLPGAYRALTMALELNPKDEVSNREAEALERAAGDDTALVARLRRLASIVGGTEAYEKRREALEIARDRLHQDTAVDAIIDEMLADSPDDPWLQDERCALRLRQGRFDDAYLVYQKRIELADGSSRAALRHEAAELAEGHLKKPALAIDQYEKLFGEEPTDSRARAGLRRLYAEGKLYKPLVTFLASLVAMSADVTERSELRLEMATLYRDSLSSAEESLHVLRDLLSDDPGHTKAAELLIALLEAAEDYTELASVLETQAEQAKARVQPLVELAHLLKLAAIADERLGDAALAIRAYGRVVADHDPTHRGALETLVRLEESSGNFAGAARALEALIVSEQVPNFAEATLRLADLLRRADDVGSIRGALERGHARAPEHSGIGEALDAYYEERGLFEELARLRIANAEREADNARKVDAYKKAAQIYADKLQQPAEAAKVLGIAAALAENDRDLLLSLSDAQTAAGQPGEAEATLRRVVASFGGRRSRDLAQIHHRLARAYLASGRKDDALTELETAFRVDPGSVAVLQELGILSLELATSADDVHIKRAHQAFRALLLQKLDQNSPISKAEVFYYLAVISHRQADDKKAIQNLERALDLDKTLTSAKALLDKLKGA